MYVEPQVARFTFESRQGVSEAVVPARRNWFVLLFLSAWMVGWAFGEVSAIQQLMSPTAKTPYLFLFAWLTGWTVGGAFALAAVLWQLGGREVLSLDTTTLAHRVEAFGIGRSRRYKLSEVKNLRATEYSANPFTNQAAMMPPLAGSGYGPVAFDYGARTFRIAAALEEAEAKALVAKLAVHMPRTLVEV